MQVCIRQRKQLNEICTNNINKCHKTKIKYNIGNKIKENGKKTYFLTKIMN